MKKILFFALTTFLFTTFLSAQQWMKDMYDPNVNFFTVQQEFNQWWEEHKEEMLNYEEEESKYGESWKIFKRWEYDMLPRVYPTGNRLPPTNSNSANITQTISSNNSLRSGNTWSYVGPVSYPQGIYSDIGMGRISCIRIDPVDTNIVYVGAASGGLWKSTNGGTTWTTLNTENLPSIGISDIAISPLNNQVIYILTGDGDGMSVASSGVWKSTNGGQSWSSTGMNYNPTFNYSFSRLIINPTNPNILLAAGQTGMFRTTNGGANWTSITSVSGTIWDMEFCPSNPNTVYACSNQFYKSINGGVSFSLITSGLPSSTASFRLAMAVSKADSNLVNIICVDSTNRFGGFFQSVDKGQTFIPKSFSPDIVQSQGMYNLAVAVSPTNTANIIAGGVQLWKSSNSGSTWSTIQYPHVDFHDAIYNPMNGNTVYAASDGGVYKSFDGGINWMRISSGLTVNQIYRIANSYRTANLFINGLQDNGTNKGNNGFWQKLTGADGMTCLIDPTNDSIIYTSSQYGVINKSNDGGVTFGTIVSNSGGVPGLNSHYGWLTSFKLSPVNHNTIYVRKDSLYKSPDGGQTWQTLSSPFGQCVHCVPMEGGEIIEISPSDTNIIFLSKFDTLWKSINGGLSFMKVANLTNNYLFLDLIISPTNPNKVWVCFNHNTYSNPTDIVYYSSNGGATWTNYSTGLPSGIFRTMVYQNNSPDGIYIGSDYTGVWYRDSTMSSWINFNNGLPNVPIYDLDISYRAGKLRAGTYGRGIWECDLYSTNTSHPYAYFESDKKIVCTGQQVSFTDKSTFSPTSWHWYFENGIPSTSSQQNPVVTYSQTGKYKVKLVASNSFGSDSIEYTNYINVSSNGNIPLSENFEGSTFPPVGFDTYDNNLDINAWIKWNGVSGYSQGSGSCRQAGYSLTYSSGAIHDLILPVLNLNIPNPLLKFDYSCLVYDTTSIDTFEILAAANCSDTFQSIFKIGHSDFKTNNYAFNHNTPLSGEWRTKVLDLSSVASNNTLIKIRAISNLRNNTYNSIFIDNININSKPLSHFLSSSNSICAGNEINFQNTSTGNPTNFTWIFSGGSPGTSSVASPQNIHYSNAGTYSVTLISSNNVSSDTIVLNNYVTVHPYPIVTAFINHNDICLGDSVTLSVSGANTYNWSNSLGTDSIITTAPFSTTNFSVIGANSFGCLDTASTNVVVHLLPNVAISYLNDSICYAQNFTLTGLGASTYTWQPFNSTVPSLNLIADTSFNVSLIGVDAHSCVNRDSLFVTVLPPPTIVAFGDTAFCLGETIPLEATGGNNYQWLPSNGLSNSTVANPTATPHISTNYIVTGYDVNNCFNKDTVAVTLKNVHLVDLGLDTTICAGTSLIVDAGNGLVSYLWSTGDTTRTITVNQFGNYSVHTIDSLHCQMSDTVTINVSVCTGLDELTENNALYIMPNPNNGNFIIAYRNATRGEIKLELFSANGQKVYEITTTKENDWFNHEFNFGNLSRGLYMLSVSINGKTASKKVTIK